MQKKILITGASGFIGSFLVEEAIKRNYQTFAGIRTAGNKKYLSDPHIHFLEMDFSNDILLDNALNNFAGEYGRFDFIIHNAGVTKSINKAMYSLVNFENTKRFVHALQRNNLVPNKFVYISSLASFGPGINACPITTCQIQQPLTRYGKSKLKAEQFLYANSAFPFLIINPAAVYGPRDKDFFFLLKSIQKHIEIYIGSTEQLLSFIHVQDLAEAIFLSMESAAIHQNLIVSDLNLYTSKTFNRIVKKNLDKKTIVFVVPVFVARLVAMFSEIAGRIKGKASVLNSEHLKEIEAMNWSVNCTEIIKLGFLPQFNLEEGLKHTIQWYKKHGWLKS
ncbi:NAD(P)-dependent oxidoreductase [Hydrotalea sp.]|uniref:NAD-dependent epimerase/dehydratase family protein n=1 Tax=Hydrotalea sp. TaxID=2881279 RepID=UPI00260D95DB|nr:NAD(P)-dependent oxidoreductase [Hydrotalea sp.]